MPAMMRRRIGPLAQNAISAALGCEGAAQSRYVFASRHGELGRTVSILNSSAEKLNGQLTGGGFFARLRNRKDKDARPQLQKRFKALADRGAQVDRLMAQVQPSPEVRQAWQEIRRDWQRVGSIISGL